MSTITKEQLRERAREKVKSLEFSITQTAFANTRAELEEELELARIALASLEAEGSERNPVLAYADSYRDMAKQGVESIPVWSVITDLERNIAPLFIAPPAPVSVPDLKPVGFLFASCDGAVAYSPADWPIKGFNLIGPIYGNVNACRTAMLQAGNSPVTPDGWITYYPDVDGQEGRAHSISGSGSCAKRIAKEIGGYATAITYGETWYPDEAPQREVK